MSASIDDNVIRPREFERVNFSIDVGQVPAGHPYVGQFVITLQVAPFRHLDEARHVERAIRDAVWSRCGLKTKTKSGDAKDAEEATGGAGIIAIADRRCAPRPGFTYAQAMSGASVKIGARAFDAIAFLERQFRQTR
jgi:hypothetical protein